MLFKGLKIKPPVFGWTLGGVLSPVKWGCYNCLSGYHKMIPSKSHLHSITPARKIVFSPFYRWENGRSERWSNLPKATQLIKFIIGVETWESSWCHHHSIQVKELANSLLITYFLRIIFKHFLNPICELFPLWVKLGIGWTRLLPNLGSAAHGSRIW